MDLTREIVELVRDVNQGGDPEDAAKKMADLAERNKDLEKRMEKFRGSMSKEELKQFAEKNKHMESEMAEVAEELRGQMLQLITSDREGSKKFLQELQKLEDNAQPQSAKSPKVAKAPRENDRPEQPSEPATSKAEVSPKKHQGHAAPAPATNITGQNNLAKVGSIIAMGAIEVAVSSLDIQVYLGHGSFHEARASKGGVYLVADWTYKNATRRPMKSFSKPMIRLISPDRIEYDADVGATLARSSEIKVDEKIISSLNPGITVQSTAVFEVSRELLSEPGWQIQIKYDSAKALYEVEVESGGLLGLRPKPVMAAERTSSVPARPTESAVDSAENLKVKLAELKGELAEVDAKMDTQRTQYKAATDTINRLTNFKRTPVREGSPEYYRCLEASKVIKKIEAGAGELKSKKAQLEATIGELEK